MDITIYLPDDLGTWAKEHDLGLSRMLRAAVEDEKRRQEAASTTLGKAATHELEVEGKERHYTARLHGTEIATDDLRHAYLGEDGEIYLYNERTQTLDRGVEPRNLRDYLSEEAYVEAMEALGETVVIDIGLPE
jgi:hypothetical protein